jgi:uncharacterized protein involved in outer membrane biogenesis
MRWRWVKWILGIAAVLIVILIVAAYVILSSYDFNKLKPQIAKVARDATGRELTLGGDIDLEIGFTPALVVEDVSFQNAPWGSRPEMAKIGRFEVQVAIIPLFRGNIEVKRFVLVEPDILVETDKSGRSNLELETPKREVPPEPAEEVPAEGGVKLPALTLNELRVEKGRLTYKDGRSGRTYAVKLASLIAGTAGIDGPIELALEGAYNGEPFELKGSLGPLSAFVNPDKAWPLELKARAVGADISAKGTIKNPLARRGIEIDFTARAKDLSNLEKLIAKPLPIKGPIEVSGRAVDPAPRTYKVSDLKVALGESDIGGSMEVNLAGKRPRLKAIMKSQKLDLRPFLAKDTAGEKGGNPAKRDRVFPDDPLPLDALNQADAAVKLQAGQVLLPQVALNDLSVDITLNDGLLTVKPLKAEIGGGTLDGRFDLKPRGKAALLATAVKINQFDLGRMLKDLKVTEVLEGKVDVSIDLKGRGGSVAELMAGLNGTTSVVMGKGRIDNKYISLVGADLSSSVFRLINPSAQVEDLTDINCFVGRVDINNGFAKTTALVLDTSTMSVVGDGVINLKTEELNLSLKPVPKEGVDTIGLGKLGLNLGELAKPFKLSGTLANPSLAVDPTQAAITIGKALGGSTLFGPVGIASALVSGGSDEENTCLAAIEAAKKGGKVEKPEEKKGAVEKTGEGLKEGVEGIGEELKKLFGR